MHITWNERKNASNRKKHGIDFETASRVFDDPDHLSKQDREVDGEPRWQTIGYVEGFHILLVAHTAEEDGIDENIRIISARRADRHERRSYDKAHGY